jgi:hypothetical protein
MDNKLKTLTFPQTRNALLLYEAVAIALEDAGFMDDNKKINKAIEALTPKDDVTKVLKQLQGYGYRDYLVEKEAGRAVDSAEAKAAHIKDYVSARFKKHMSNPKTGVKATKMYNDAYPSVVAENPSDDTPTA